MPAADLDLLDEYLTRIFVSRQRPSWRRELFEGLTHLRYLSDLRVLRAVERRSAANDGASVGAVAEDMGIEHSTASRAVTAVVRAGFLDKTQSAGDQRRCTLVLTETGKEALAEATDRRRSIVADRMADWPRSDLRALRKLLGTLAEDFEAKS